MYLKLLLKRAWSDAARFLKDNVLPETLLVLAGAIVGYARGDTTTQIVNPLIYALGTSFIVITAVFSYNLLRSTAGIYYEQSKEIIALKEQLRPTLQIELKEDDDRLYYDSPSSFELSDLFDSSRDFKATSHWRLCRLAVRNSSKSVSVETVEVDYLQLNLYQKSLRANFHCPYIS